MKSNINSNFLTVASAFAIVCSLTLLRLHEDAFVFGKMKREQVCVERYYFRDGKWFDLCLCPEMMPRYFWDIGLYVIDSTGHKYKLLCDFYAPYRFRTAMRRYASSDEYAGMYDSFQDLSKSWLLKGCAGLASPKWLLLFDACLALLFSLSVRKCFKIKSIKGNRLKGSGTPSKTRLN